MPQRFKKKVCMSQLWGCIYNSILETYLGIGSYTHRGRLKGLVVYMSLTDIRVVMSRDVVLMENKVEK